jgi:flagellar basal body rod protein FlgG
MSTHVARRILMTSSSAIALSGMNAAQAGLQASAHNLANLGTSGSRRQRVDQSAAPGGGVTATVSPEATAGNSEVADVVGLLQAKNAFLANLAVFRAADRMTGTLLDQAA